MKGGATGLGLRFQRQFHAGDSVGLDNHLPGPRLSSLQLEKDGAAAGIDVKQAVGMAQLFAIEKHLGPRRIGADV